jgi:hypothetical protein
MSHALDPSFWTPHSGPLILDPSFWTPHSGPVHLHRRTAQHSPDTHPPITGAPPLQGLLPYVVFIQALCASPARLLGQEIILDNTHRGKNGLCDEVDVAMCVGDAKILYPKVGGPTALPH